MAFALVFFSLTLRFYLNNNDTCLSDGSRISIPKRGDKLLFWPFPQNMHENNCAKTDWSAQQSQSWHHFNNLQTINNGCYIAVTQKGCVNKYNQRNITSFVTSSCRLDSSCYGTVAALLWSRPIRPPNLSWVEEGRMAAMAYPSLPGHFKYLQAWRCCISCGLDVFKTKHSRRYLNISHNIQPSHYKYVLCHVCLFLCHNMKFSFPMWRMQYRTPPHSCEWLHTTNY